MELVSRALTASHIITPHHITPHSRFISCSRNTRGSLLGLFSFAMKIGDVCFICSWHVVFLFFALFIDLCHDEGWGSIYLWWESYYKKWIQFNFEHIIPPTSRLSNNTSRIIALALLWVTSVSITLSLNGSLQCFRLNPSITLLLALIRMWIRRPLLLLIKTWLPQVFSV